MAEQQQSGRHLPGAPTSGSSSKADSKLRLVGTDGNVVVPPDARPTDAAPTVISKKGPKSLLVGDGDNLSAKNLYGQRLAHFELLEPIGVGGMAAVLRARDTQLDRIVALKILPPDMAEDQENVDRFHQEARAAAKLDHPNIAQVFFCGEDRGLYFIAFEFVEGDNLRTVIEKRGRLPVAESVRYVIQVAAGLDHAASRGVVHRDIKPSNIIITPNGAAKLVDMGLARSLERTSDQGLTHSGMTLGTFDYISPEQALEPRDADVRSDIYSLGCTFYHMLTGQPPVPEGTAAKKLYHHQHLAPIDPRQLNPEIPDDVAAILMRMMCKEPAGRYQKPAQLVQHLYQVAEKVGAGGNVPEGAMFLDAPLPGAPRFRPMLTVVLGGLALGVLLLLISLAPNSKGPGVEIVGKENLPGEVISPTLPKKDLPARMVLITKGEELKTALEQGNNSELILPVDVNLNARPIVCNLDGNGNKSMLVKGKDRQQKIRIKYQPDEKEEKDQVPCLTFKVEAGNSIRFENICFELPDTGSLPESMLAVEGAGKVSFHKCTFIVRITLGKSSVREVASLLIRNLKGDPKPQVTLSECYFEQGQAAVAVEGPVNLQATNCAFGLNNVQFVIRGQFSAEDKQPACELFLKKCSAFILNGPAFRFDGDYLCDLKVKDSIFSNPESKEVQLIRLNNGKMPLRYSGSNNRYHNLNDLLWKSGEDGRDGDVARDIDQLNSLLKDVNKAENKASDNDSQVLERLPSPWKSPFPKRLLEEKNPRPKEAFQLTLDAGVWENKLVGIGIDLCAWGEQDKLVRVETVKKTGLLPENIRIVDPDANDDDSKKTGVYSKLTRSVVGALPSTGGTINIKHGKASRNVAVGSITLDEEGQDLKDGQEYELIFRGDETLHPVLTFSDRPDKSLFRLKDKFNGKVHFENLEFFLDSENDQVKKTFPPIGVVTLYTGGRCSFKNCVFTLKRPSQGSLLSVASFADERNEMGAQMMPALKKLPQVTFENCLIRGEGDLLSIRSGRSLEVGIDNSLLALTGSAVSFHGNEMPTTAPSQEPTSLSVEHVSAFLTEPFIRARNMEALAPIRFESVHDNLFVSLSPSQPNQPFLSLPIDSEKFDWRKGERNHYVNYFNMLELKSSSMIDQKQWMVHEADARHSASVFSFPGTIVFTELNLDNFKPQPSFRARLSGFGANLDAKMLPPFTSSRKLAVGTQ